MFASLIRATPAYAVDPLEAIPPEFQEIAAVSSPGFPQNIIDLMKSLVLYIDQFVYNELFLTNATSAGISIVIFAAFVKAFDFPC